MYSGSICSGGGPSSVARRADTHSVNVICGLDASSSSRGLAAAAAAPAAAEGEEEEGEGEDIQTVCWFLWRDGMMNKRCVLRAKERFMMGFVKNFWWWPFHETVDRALELEFSWFDLSTQHRPTDRQTDRKKNVGK